ncbi:SLC13 family permease [Candidatus Omnitrophota bacterium]
MRRLSLKLTALVFISSLVGFSSISIGLNGHQALSVAILSASILGTLFFWNFRLSFVFLGTSILLISRAIDIEMLVRFSSLEVILFLVGMMVLVGLLKEAGLFAWIVSLILRIRNLTAKRFFIATSIASALLACAVDEVTSIIFIVAAVLEICDYFEIDPVPFVICAVLTTNIGSAGTVLGNPIGIFIATKAGLTFEDFIAKAFPLMILCLTVTIMLLLFWYRKVLKEFDRKIKDLGANDMLIRLISVPPDRQLKISLCIFGVTLFFIALHHRLELFFGLEANTLLLSIPLISSGIVMIWRWRKAREYIEHHVEWWTLLFFMLLFAQAGTLKYTGATDVLAKRLVETVIRSHVSLTSMVLWISVIGSSILDNVVLVAAFTPIIQSFKELGLVIQPLWWALLFGGCFGGNMTLVGSTANIVALGMLEKERNIKITFFRWLRVGLVTTIISATIIWFSLLWLPMFK